MARSVSMGRAYVAIGAQNAPLYKALSKAEKRIARFGASVGKAAQSFASIGAAILAPFAIATRKGLEFEKQMVEVAAVTGATDKQFKALEDTARKLGATTSFTATEAADAMTQLGRAGFTTNQIIAAIPSTLALARASGLGMGEVAEIMADVSRSFQISASEIEGVADAITFTANNSTTNIQQLGAAMKNVAPAAAAVGQNLETVSAALGVLANRGIKGEEAGTALAAVLLKLADVNVQDKLDDLGVSLRGTNNRMRDFTDILADLEKRLEVGGDIERVAILNDLFGRRGLKAAVNIGSLREELGRFRDNIKAAGGVTRRTADIMEGNLNRAVNLALSAFEALQITVSKKVQPVITKWLNTLTSGINTIARFADENETLLQTVLKVGAGAVALGASLGALAIAAKGASLAIGLAGGLATAAKVAGAAISAFNTAATIASVTSASSLLPSLGGAAAAFKGITVASIAAKLSVLKFQAAIAVGIIAPFAAAAAIIGSVIAITYKLYRLWEDNKAINETLNNIDLLNQKLEQTNAEIDKLNQQQGQGFNFTSEQANTQVEDRILGLKRAGKTAEQINKILANDEKILRQQTRNRYTEANLLSKQNFEAQLNEKRQLLVATKKAILEDKASTLKTEKEKAEEVLRIRLDILQKAKALQESFEKAQIKRSAALQERARDEAFKKRLAADPEAEARQIQEKLIDAQLRLEEQKAQAQAAIEASIAAPTKDIQRQAEAAVAAYDKQARAVDDLAAKRREALEAVATIAAEEKRKLEESAKATIDLQAQITASFDKNEFVKGAKSQFEGLTAEAQKFLLTASKQAEKLKNDLISGAISQGDFDKQIEALQGRVDDAFGATRRGRGGRNEIEIGSFGTFSAREAAGRFGQESIKIAADQLTELKGIRKLLKRRDDAAFAYQ